MPTLYTILSDGPSLTQHLKRQWLDKHQKNHLRTRKTQVRPYTHPKRNSLPLVGHDEHTIHVLNDLSHWGWDLLPGEAL